MVLSISTQRDMYKYILSDKKVSLNVSDSNSTDIIANEIIYTSRKLFLRSELYICKIQLSVDESEILQKRKNYNCSSNLLIFYTLHSIKNDIDFANEECNLFVNEKIIKDLLGHTDCDIDDELDKVCKSLQLLDNLDTIPETGSPLRHKLIKLCKLYLLDKEFEVANRGKTKEEYDLAKESFLAEQALRIFTDSYFGKISKRRFDSKDKYAQAIIPDIIVIDNKILVVIDVKVYKDVMIKDRYSHKYYYCSNANRFQVNSYIGKALEELMGGISESKVGILLHLISRNSPEKDLGYDGESLTVESARPIYLHVIEDRGLDYILDEYKKLLDRYIGRDGDN